MTTEMFLLILTAVSVMTGLFTEAIKGMVEEFGLRFKSNNVLAGIVAVLLSAFGCYSYTVIAGAAIDSKMVVCYISLALLSWLSAMVGYDKVMQALAQIGRS